MRPAIAGLMTGAGATVAFFGAVILGAGILPKLYHLLGVTGFGALVLTLGVTLLIAGHFIWHPKPERRS